MLYLLANVECGPGVWLGILVFESFAVLLNFGACYIVTPFCYIICACRSCSYMHEYVALQ